MNANDKTDDGRQMTDDKKKSPTPPPESGGPKGPEPTRYGDWEIAGKCVDF